MDEKTLFAILDRLENVFGVDVSEARQLTGEALKNWVDLADETLFQSLLVDLQKPDNGLRGMGQRLMVTLPRATGPPMCSERP